MGDGKMRHEGDPVQGRIDYLMRYVATNELDASIEQFRELAEYGITWADVIEFMAEAGQWDQQLKDLKLTKPPTI